MTLFSFILTLFFSLAERDNSSCYEKLGKSSEQTDTIVTSNVMLQDVNVVSSIKENGLTRLQPSSITLLGKKQLDDNHITSLKATSSLVPNLFMPDYGSRLTSAIYIRGIGSRINTPAVGLYVDNIPYADKSAFDFNFYDIERVDILRGPQGTLYGNNTMGGLVRIYTKNPFNYTGTNIKLGYATSDNHRNASLTHYHRVSDKFAFSASAYYEGGDGFFKNDFTGKKVDDIQSGGGRIRAIYKPTERLSFDFVTNYDYSKEGAYPYYYIGSATDREDYAHLLGKISNNRESSYLRGLFNADLNIEYKADNWLMNAVTGYQNINDKMFMDQDFISDDIYTLEQCQFINTLNEEIIFKSSKQARWQWISGANIMYQWLQTEGPVTFYRDGLNWLESSINTVLPNINKIPMLQAMGFTGMNLKFRGDELRMNGNYQTPTFSAALFHQSTYHFTDCFSSTIGLRLNYEHQKMDYYSPVEVNYAFMMPNSKNDKMSVELQELKSHILYEGIKKNDYFRILPKFAMKYDIDETNNIYLSASIGQRSGGYNLQMFSDLLQGAMQADMMEGVKGGVSKYLDNISAINPNMPKSIPDPENSSQTITLSEYVQREMGKSMPATEIPTTEQVVYKPEYSLNFELGTHLTLLKHILLVDAAIFYNRIYNQQVVRFAPSGLGRMMVNASRSHSRGGEVAVRYMPNNHLTLSGNYGFTKATFIKYDDGKEDYSGNYVPFLPMHTMNLDASYTFNINKPLLNTITIGANCTGNGSIYWTESNTLKQPFYATIGARLSFDTPHLTLMIWGKNLTATKYNTFCFESANRIYEQHSKPLQIGIDLSIKL